jgi:uncharacterized protein YutD
MNNLNYLLEFLYEYAAWCIFRCVSFVLEDVEKINMLFKIAK